MGKKRDSQTMSNKVFGWLGKLSMKVKILLSIIIAISCLVALYSLFFAHHMFIAAETIHALGIMVLIYKLTKMKTCSGLSLKSQELTAIYLGVRVYCSVDMEAGIHTVLYSAALVATIWVIYMIRYKLKSTYIHELDNMPHYYMIVPSAILAVLIHPDTKHAFTSNLLWAFCLNLESVSVLPQLRVMQNAKMIEPFTAHYVFALGVARFLGCAYWVIAVLICIFGIVQIVASRGAYLEVFTSGYLWIPMAFLAELVQTFILADFCYYYVKSVIYNKGLVSMAIHV